MLEPGRPNRWEEFKDHTLTLLFWLAGSLIDAGITIGWVRLQIFIGEQVKGYAPIELESLFFLVFQFLFGIATFIPVALWVYKDARIMWIRVNNQIKREQDKYKITRRRSTKTKSDQSISQPSTVRLVEPGVVHSSDVSDASKKSSYPGSRS